jgi:uncharacterized membrane protein YccC
LSPIAVPSLPSIAHAFRAFIELIDRRSKKAQAYLDAEIEPILHNMESIHLEYMAAFQQLREIAETRERRPQ